MGTCKKCKEVFSTLEMVDGYCKECAPDGAKEMSILDKELNTLNGYGTSIIISKYVSFVGWVMVLIGLFLIFTLIKEGGIGLSLLISSVPLTIFIGGFVLVLIGQASRAVMENTNQTKQILQTLKKQYIQQELNKQK